MAGGFTSKIGGLAIGVLLVLLAAGLAVPAQGDDASPVVTFGPEQIIGVGEDIGSAPRYSPSTVHVAPGGSVTFQPIDGFTFKQHPLVFVDGSPGKDTPDSTAFVKAFPTVGRFEFYCAIHGEFDPKTGHVRGMSGVVNVTTNKLPIAKFTTRAHGQNVTFDASASFDPDGSITTYVWHFQTDNEGHGFNVQTTGAKMTRRLPHTDWVSLTVTDNNADVVGPESSSTKSQKVTVPDKAPPKVLDVSTSLKLSDLTRGRAVMTFVLSEPGSASATVKSGATTVATGKATTTGPPEQVKLTLKPTAAARKLKAGAKLKLSLTVSDKAGNHAKRFWSCATDERQSSCQPAAGP